MTPQAKSTRAGAIGSGSPVSQDTPRLPAFLLGVGFGGFVDGILLHQILQWHHMISSTAEYPASTLSGLEANTVADGFFHVFAWTMLALGVWLVHRRWREGALAPPWRIPLGLMLAGWGAFNLADGLINHHLLGIHHVRDDLGAPLGWDLGYLALGAAQLALGLWVARRRDGGTREAVSR